MALLVARLERATYGGDGTSGGRTDMEPLDPVDRGNVCGGWIAIDYNRLCGTRVEERPVKLKRVPERRSFTPITAAVDSGGEGRCGPAWCVSRAGLGELGRLRWDGCYVTGLLQLWLELLLASYLYQPWLQVSPSHCPPTQTTAARLPATTIPWALILQMRTATSTQHPTHATFSAPPSPGGAAPLAAGSPRARPLRSS